MNALQMGEDLGKLFGEGTMNVEVHKVVTISHDEASLCSECSECAVQKETRYFRALHATTSQPFNLEPLGEE